MPRKCLNCCGISHVHVQPWQGVNVLKCTDIRLHIALVAIYERDNVIYCRLLIPYEMRFDSWITRQYFSYSSSDNDEKTV